MMAYDAICKNEPTGSVEERRRRGDETISVDSQRKCCFVLRLAAHIFLEQIGLPK